MAVGEGDGGVRGGEDARGVHEATEGVRAVEETAGKVLDRGEDTQDVDHVSGNHAIC